MRGTLKRLAGGAVAVVLLAGATNAEAESFTVKTKFGNTCRIETIAQPTQFGLSVQDCSAKAQHVIAAGYLYNTGRPIDAKRFGPGRVPYREAATYRPDFGELPSGDTVRIEFEIQLKSRHRRSPKWRKRTGPEGCRVTITRHRNDTLACTVWESTS